MVPRTMADGCQGFAPADDSVADTPRAGAVVRPAAAGPRLHCFGHRGGLGTGPHTIGRWAAALGEAQQAALNVAVQELPTESGIKLANWNWKVVHQFVSERFGISLVPQHLSELPPPGGIRVQAPQETAAQG